LCRPRMGAVHLDSPAGSPRRCQPRAPSRTSSTATVRSASACATSGSTASWHRGGRPASTGGNGGFSSATTVGRVQPFDPVRSVRVTPQPVGEAAHQPASRSATSILRVTRSQGCLSASGRRADRPLRRGPGPLGSRWATAREAKWARWRSTASSTGH
jgi:hypothetical protein